MKAFASISVLLLCFVGCRTEQQSAAQPAPGGPPPAAAGWRAETVVEGISHPWGIAWLPDGRAMITARDDGAIHLFTGNGVEDLPVEGMPELFTGGQGGLLDIALHPQDKDNPRRVYMTMSTGTAHGNRVILARGQFDGKRIHEIQEIFRAVPDKTGGQHFGSRLLWLPDSTLLMSIGDGGNPPLRIGDMLAREQAQNLRSHLGAIVRLTEDGQAAKDNPFVGRQDALPEIWTYGHRNIQGLALDRETGRVWANEHGPRGGDELSLIIGGRNYGWPLQTQGRDYRTGQQIGRDAVEGMEQPKAVWTPAHAPSGLAFYTGERFPHWRGSLLSGGLVSQDIRRIELDGQANVVRQERLNVGRRVRAVNQGPDGHIYVLTDEEDGQLLRIVPE